MKPMKLEPATFGYVIMENFGNMKVFNACLSFGSSSSQSYPSFRLSSSDEIKVTQELLELFKVGSLQELSRKPYYTLSHQSFIFALANLKGEIFSLFSNYYNKDSNETNNIKLTAWREALFEQYPALKQENDSKLICNMALALCAVNDESSPSKIVKNFYGHILLDKIIPHHDTGKKMKI